MVGRGDRSFQVGGRGDRSFQVGGRGDRKTVCTRAVAPRGSRMGPLITEARGRQPSRGDRSFPVACEPSNPIWTPMLVTCRETRPGLQGPLPIKEPSKGSLDLPSYPQSDLP